MYSDYHVHSLFSGDSNALLTDIIENAISKGMSRICITDHMDLDFPGDDPLLFTFNIDDYQYTITKLKEDYSNRIKIMIGIEMGLEPHLSDRIHNIASSYPFDFIIGSSHIVNRRDPYFPDFYNNRTEDEAFAEYFESILTCIDSIDDFDVYGHLDYIVRYAPNKNKYYSYQKFSEIIDAILIKLINKNKGIEVNTAGYAKGLNNPNPCCDIIKRYYELGGRIITIGSDAHIPEDIGSHFTDAAAILKNCGFKYYTVFENRIPEFVKL
ncbi:MAG: histidinol-phosphatase HisJ family protein [Eubacterium sp.]